MADDDPVFPPGYPEDAKQQVISARDKEKMRGEAVRHRVFGFLAELNDEQLEAGVEMMEGIIFAQNPLTVANWYSGLLTALRTKYGHCIACGKKHDDEMAGLLDGK